MRRAGFLGWGGEAEGGLEGGESGAEGLHFHFHGGAPVGGGGGGGGGRELAERLRGLGGGVGGEEERGVGGGAAAAAWRMQSHQWSFLPFHQASQRCFDGFEIGKRVEAIGAYFEFGGGLGATKEEHGEQSAFWLVQAGKEFTDEVFIFGGAGAGQVQHGGQFFPPQPGEGVVDDRFFEGDDGVAVARLVTGGDDAGHGQRVSIGGGGFFF